MRASWLAPACVALTGICAGCTRTAPQELDAGVSDAAVAMGDGDVGVLLGGATGAVGANGPQRTPESTLAFACARVAELVDVKALATRPGDVQVTSVADATDNDGTCTGSAGECLHWCRVARVAAGKPTFLAHFGVEPHSHTIAVCESADIERCHHGGGLPLADWRKRHAR
jgi:hypothetical protein